MGRIGVTDYNALTIAIAALGVSILSAGIACWSAYSSHKSRKASERMAEITRIKREEELMPKFEAWLEFRKGMHFLHLKNAGIVTYSSVVFNFEAADGLAELPITGLQMGGWGGDCETGGSSTLGYLKQAPPKFL